jgi:hypothetical protein
MATKIKLRRDTSANWASNNPVLALAEVGIVTDAASDAVKLKIGDGVLDWNTLAFFAPSPNNNKVTDSATISKLEDDNNWFNNLYSGPAITGQVTGDWYDNGTISYKFITSTTVSRIPYSNL